MTGHQFTDAEVVTMLKALLARPIQAEESLLPLPPAETLPPLLDYDAGAGVEVDAVATDACLALLEALPRRPWNCTAHGFLHKLLQQSGVTPLTDNKAPPAEASSIVSEEAVLAQFLIDQSVLDYESLHYLPSTIAASALFLSRIVLDRLSRAPLTLTHSQGLIHTSSREVLALHEGSRPFVARDPSSHLPAFRTSYPRLLRENTPTRMPCFLILSNFLTSICSMVPRECIRQPCPNHRRASHREIRRA